MLLGLTVAVVWRFVPYCAPVSGPGLVSTGIFAFLGAWGEFFLTVVLASTLRSKTVVYGHRSI